MTTQLDRRDILPLLQELQEACRRPLFTEIGLDDAVRKQERRAKLHQKLPDLLKVNEDKGSSDNDTTKEPKKRSWRQVCCSKLWIYRSVFYRISSQILFSFLYYFLL